jgi:PEP-CTERM motif
MFISRLAFGIALLGATLTVANAAPTIKIDPTSDGSVRGVCEGCAPWVWGDGFVLLGGDSQGVVKFSSTAVVGEVEKAILSVNPYGLPLWGPEVAVYAYESSLAQIDLSDTNAGALIGVWSLPPNLGYGEDAFFDVTSFILSKPGPYIAFNLRSEGTDVLSSLEINYGHASQLHITTAVPEPGTYALMMLGLAGIGMVARRRRST